MENVLERKTGEVCQNCKKNLSTEDHLCPYKSDVNNDSETLCNCCDDCRFECCQDI